MRKLFTIDDFAVAAVSALASGYSETLSMLFGAPRLLCIVISIGLAIAAEEIIGTIIFSEQVQRNAEKRLTIYAGILVLFLAAHAVSIRWMGVSMVDYVLDEFQYVIGLPVLGFLINMLIRAYKIHKIRSVYGDGSKGYVFDVSNDEVEEINLYNRPVRGEYDSDLAVKTRTGVFVGERHGKTIFYLGIPYAKPPVGELRWKAPEPLPSSETVFEALNFGPSALQVEHQGSILRLHRQSEDCLYLNICVSTQEAEARRPVLVLFHHGDFTIGGSADPLLYGEQIVKAHPDIIFVSFNYRLGILGYIDFSEVPGGEAYPDAPNLGLLDQIAALQWIRENIAAFGGDPDRITAMGFESGAVSISLLAACDRAKGLFRKAFVFFGSPESAYETPEASRALAKDLLTETRTSTMAELSKLEPKALKDAAQKLWKNMCAPTLDGSLLPSDGYKAYETGAASGIEFIFGIPDSEQQIFRAFVGSTNFKNHLAADADLFELRNAVGMYRCAENLAKGGNSVHLLYWDEKPLIKKLGSGTVDAVAAFLGNSDALQMYGNVLNADQSEVLQALLAKFVTDNDLQLYPNEIRGIDAFEWKAFPKALIISDGRLTCDTVEVDLTGKM